jgi:hypothetical protein
MQTIISLCGQRAAVLAAASLMVFSHVAAGQNSRPRSGPPDLRQHWNSQAATNRGTVRFSHPPMRPEDIGTVVPMGLMVGAHVTPSDHVYFYPKDPHAGKYAYDVYAPADGFITYIQHRTQLAGSSETQRTYDDYRLVIEHTGTFWTYYDLITRLDAKVLEAIGGMTPGQSVRVRAAVKAGQVIGKIGGRSLDMGVVNAEYTRPGFLVPAHYEREPWKIHTVDPFDFFDEPVKGRLLALNVRKAEPRGGKIDFDLDGKLVGNWFLEGSNGYAGAGDPRGYWMGHLAVVYHHVDPSKVMFSIGDFEGKPRQFWVKGNAPDPAKVGMENGVVKYELVYGAIGSSGQAFQGMDTNKVHGVALLQVLKERKLKVEVFPGKMGSDVNGFTKGAKVFER